MNSSAKRNDRIAARGKLALAIAFAVGLGVAYWFLPDAETLLRRAAESEQMFRSCHAEHPALVYGVAFLLYVVVTGLSLPGATVMTLAYAWLFGFWRTVLLVSFASTAGATIAFLISRYLLYNFVQHQFGRVLGKFNHALEREGAFYLFTLRLIPVVPFFVINAVMGLTPIRASIFWRVSQLGMLPGTILYVWVGSSVPTLADLAENGLGSILSWKLVIAFVALGTFPLVVRKFFSVVKFRK